MSQTSAESEWTFVKCQKKKRRGKQQHTTNPNIIVEHHPKGLKRERQLAQAIQIQSALHIPQEDEKVGVPPRQDAMKGSLKEMIEIIEKCKTEIKSFGHHRQCCMNHDTTTGSIFDIMTIVKSIKDASTIHHDEKKRRTIHEIICYGIGNFSHARGHKYNSPLIQLACVLILREHFATERHLQANDIKKMNDPNPYYSKDHLDTEQEDNKTVPHDESVFDTHPEINQSHPLSHSAQQRLVPMIYFEPLIKPLERQVLRHYHIQVLDTNQQGKYSISQTSINQGETSSMSCTLFYMPHCPMRLYSNVLWANWNENIMLDGKIIFFGNSFLAYDDRIISSQQKNDKTNAIFPLLPFVSEIPVLSTKNIIGSSRVRNTSRTYCRDCNMITDSLSEQDIEMSFNDCAIISFSQKDLAIEFPSRPKEYDPNAVGLDGELL